MKIRSRRTPAHNPVGRSPKAWSPRHRPCVYFTSPPDMDGDYSLTADEVFDSGRRTHAVATGVLDPRGQMLYRVTIPIKQPIGFDIGRKDEIEDTVCHVVPEDVLGTIPGALTHDDEDDEDEEDDE